MFSFKVLLCALALTLLAATVQSWSDGPLSGPELTRLYNSPVYNGEWMVRQLGSSSAPVGILSHTGVRVTLGDGSKWLIHKGPDYGVASETVVTPASQMSSGWSTLWTKNFNGRKTVADLVRVGGGSYNLLFNCHVASIRMILQ